MGVLGLNCLRSDSRLEAKWARFFDFALSAAGAKPLLVDVKPITAFDEATANRWLWLRRITSRHRGGYVNGLSPAALWDSWLQTPNKLLYVVRFEVVELMEEPTP